MVDKMLIPSPHFIIQNNPKVVWSAILSIPEKKPNMGVWGYGIFRGIEEIAGKIS